MNTNKILLQTLKDIKAKQEEKGFIATIELAIEELEEQIAEEETEKIEIGYIPEGAEADYEDFSGASDDNGEGR
jgi:hypothetical protein